MDRLADPSTAEHAPVDNAHRLRCRRFWERGILRDPGRLREICTQGLRDFENGGLYCYRCEFPSPADRSFGINKGERVCIPEHQPA